MKNMIRLLCVMTGFAACAAFAGDNELTDAEKAAGWKLLFDGKSLEGFRALNKPEIGPGWKVVDGTLTLGKASKGGDIATKEKFSNFELTFEFRLTKGANSGVKYNIQDNGQGGVGSVGYEFQVLDDENHPDAKLGHDQSRTVGSLYDVIPAAKDKKVNAIGEWNTGRIVATATHVEHWLNGMKVVEYGRNSDALKAEIAKSKFAKTAGFAERSSGYILLQDHGDEVSYRNLKIKPLP